jgi:ribosomal protein S27AE
MLFIYSLERHELLLLISVFLILAAVCYYFAVRSRKTYTCPECGEKTKVEHMDTARCGMCGSLLNLDSRE